MIYVQENSKSNNNFVRSDYIQDDFTFVVKIGHCLGILPVDNLSSYSQIKYSWKSLKSFYTYILLLIFMTISIFCLLHWTVVKFSFKQLAIQMHFINAFISLTLYMRLARKWPKFSKLWHRVDQAMTTKYGHLRGLNIRVKICTAIIFLLTLVEYVLWIIYQYKQYVMKHNDKFNVKSFYVAVFRAFFSVVPFSEVSAIIVTIITLTGYLVWSFNDLFIISLSSAFALRFKQITDRLFSNEKKAKTNDYWIELRSDYDRLVHLSTKLDKYVSYIVLLSYSANVFFLLIQLSMVIGHLNNTIQVVYYTYSFFFLIARLVAVSLYGAWINEESKEPAVSLNSVPSATYNIEIRRLLLQISFNDVAITGNKMFKVTRGLLLNIAGAIVTYELVMIQFNNSIDSH